MQLTVEQRDSGQIPLGALAMLPLFVMPIGGWLVENGWVDFGTCAMKATLGIPCLTCGATRATMRLLHGDLAGAMSFQPMMIVVYALLALWGLVSLGMFAANRRARLKLSPLEDRIFKGALIVIPLVNWAYLIIAGV